MTAKESVIFLFWEGDFEYEEKFYIDEEEMREFKNKTLKTLKKNNLPVNVSVRNTKGVE